MLQFIAASNANLALYSLWLATMWAVIGGYVVFRISYALTTKQFDRLPHYYNR